MTRKDTILIAVVINAGLLAILFTTAVIYDTDKAIVPMELAAPLADNKPAPSEPFPQNLIATAPATGDEVDNVLKYYATPSAQPIIVDTQPETYTPEPIGIQANAPDEEELPVREWADRSSGQGMHRLQGLRFFSAIPRGSSKSSACSTSSTGAASDYRRN